MKLKKCIALLALCLFTSPVLADNSSKKETKPVSTSKVKATKSDDEVLSLINQITADVVRADERLADVEIRLLNLDSRVSTLEKKQEETIVQLTGFKANQQEQLAQAAELQTELAAAHQKADGLQAQAQQLAAEANVAKGQAAQANQMAAQANQQAAQAARQAQIANDTAAPKGPIGRILSKVFPRMLGHQN